MLATTAQNTKGWVKVDLLSCASANSRSVTRLYCLDAAATWLSGQKLAFALGERYAQRLVLKVGPQVATIGFFLCDSTGRLRGAFWRCWWRARRFELRPQRLRRPVAGISRTSTAS